MEPRRRLRIASLLAVVLLISSGLAALSGCGPKAGMSVQLTLAAGQQVANICTVGTALLYKTEPTSPQFDHLLLPTGKSVEVPGFVTSQLSPAMSPDGKTVAYHDGASLILRPLPTGKVTRVPLPDSVGASDIIRWSPDSRYVLFHWTTKEADGSVASRVYRVDQGTTAPTEVIKSERIDGMGAVWSPDGKTVAVATYTGTNADDMLTTVLTYDPATGTVKPELTEQKGFYTLDWSKTPVWQPIPQYRTDAQGNALVACDATTKVPRRAVAGSNFDLIGYRFTLIQVQDAAGKVLREIDLTPVLKTLGYDASRFNTIYISPEALIPGTSQWLLGVNAYYREGQGYTDAWQAFICYDGERGVARALPGDDAAVANGIGESLNPLQGNAAILISNDRMYMIKRTASGSSLLVLDPIGATTKRLATLGTERAQALVWDQMIYCADSKSVWAIDTATGERRNIAQASADWRIVPESIWALNMDRAGEQLRWAQIKGEVDPAKPTTVTIEAMAVSGK